MTKKFVDFVPDAELANALITSLNNDVAKMPEQEYATHLATIIASIAFVMHSSNDTETVKRLFLHLVEDAAKQFKRREQELAKGSIIQ